ncbi:mannose-1-phosphate guanylyltransferase [Bacillus sp. FJAT-27916]|uniref:sugar phosphate nucleotidyltransferase n=1 Tax=Bacillus sp. FJAT-27916 TaxID=1679169 RepID=UPI0006707E6B|nr:sugar phosphate nucleotidyltransferase [Bacillus sp. FJAT-27916]KMY45382.1 mannose-1-phosphate guanylyltransferase [Bacillus sp. FJAT-27916]
MEVILLSGGSGQRLWPLSNDSRSKQFLKVLECQKGSSESMAQRVWRQLGEVGLQDKAVIATSIKQMDILKNQLGGQVPIVVEPKRRDTFPAIALTAAYLSSVKRIAPEEVVAVLPIDSYVDNDFYESVKDLEHVLDMSGASIALMGVEPDIPSSRFGYIIPKERQNNHVLVSHFVEKPSDEYALKLIEKGALWNCGVFAFHLGFILSILEEMGLPQNYADLLAHYEQLPKISFDFEVVEKTKSIAALPYNGAWRDLGVWSTLTEHMSEHFKGSGVICPDSKNTHIINELDIPVAVLGISNAVIVSGPDGILVSDKSVSHDLKKYIFHFNKRPMYEERRWGWYKILDHTVYEGESEVITRRMAIRADSSLSYQRHEQRKEIWTILTGEGSIILDNELFEVRAGSIIEIPAGTKHALKAHTDMELIEVQKGPVLSEEDVYRICLEWEDILPLHSSLTL